MATEKEILALVNKHFSANGLVDWNFTFNVAKKRLGYCDSRNKLISISFPYAKVNSLEQVEETLLHEIAHAKANEEAGYSVGHGDLWKRWAVKLGAKPERLAKVGTYIPAPRNVVYECKTCKKEFCYYKKLTKIYFCKVCATSYNNGKFHTDYMLVFKKRG